MGHLGKGMITRLQSPCKRKINTPSQIQVSTLPTFVTIAAREDLGRVPSAQKLEDPWVQHGRKNRGSTAINRKKKETKTDPLGHNFSSCFKVRSGFESQPLQVPLS